ncbi:MAG: histidine kinase dimerization/phospho-acceptor domain-containing protein, partial [Myxococcota bacterium]
MSDELKRIARLEAELESVDHFISIAAHDLKAPMRGIRNAATLLRQELRSNERESIERRLEQIEVRTARLEAMLSGLADYARCCVPRSRTTRAISVVKELRDLADAAIDHAGGAGRVLEVELCSEVDSVSMDRVVFRHVIGNLLDNSWRHSDSERCNVSLTAALEGETLIVSV